MQMSDKVSFTIDVKGETSGRNFTGLFEVRTKLTVRDTLREDEIRRTALGLNPLTAGDYATAIAASIAYLTIRIIKAPDWWSKEFGGGLELEDENVLVEVNNAAVAAIKTERERLTKAAEKGQKDLKKIEKTLKEDE